MEIWKIGGSKSKVSTQLLDYCDFFAVPGIRNGEPKNLSIRQCSIKSCCLRPWFNKSSHHLWKSTFSKIEVSRLKRNSSLWQHRTENILMKRLQLVFLPWTGPPERKCRWVTPWCYHWSQKYLRDFSILRAFLIFLD